MSASPSNLRSTGAAVEIGARMNEAQFRAVETAVQMRAANMKMRFDALSREGGMEGIFQRRSPFMHGARFALEEAGLQVGGGVGYVGSLLAHSGALTGLAGGAAAVAGAFAAVAVAVHSIHKGIEENAKAVEVVAEATARWEKILDRINAARSPAAVLGENVGVIVSRYKEAEEALDLPGPEKAQRRAEAQEYAKFGEQLKRALESEEKAKKTVEEIYENVQKTKKERKELEGGWFTHPSEATRAQMGKLDKQIDEQWGEWEAAKDAQRAARVKVAGLRGDEARGNLDRSARAAGESALTKALTKENLEREKHEESERERQIREDEASNKKRNQIAHEASLDRIRLEEDGFQQKWDLLQADRDYEIEIAEDAGENVRAVELKWAVKEKELREAAREEFDRRLAAASPEAALMTAMGAGRAYGGSAFVGTESIQGSIRDNTEKTADGIEELVGWSRMVQGLVMGFSG